MLFNSLHFLVFFPIVTALYFLLPHRFRWLLLLAASCYFYMAFIPAYILILAFTIVIDYIAGIWIENSQGRKRKWLLITSLCANIGVLFVFKYFNFINESIENAVRAMGNGDFSSLTLSIILPIGLSFHTFQAMSYTIEVYRGNQKAERHFGIYALYVMFYPQLVAGPIERPQNLLHQFYEKHEFEYQRVTDGLKLMMWGLFKKVVAADRLAVVVDQIYNNPTEYQGIYLLIAVVFFTFQVYCDFSGYSDIAIGSAQVMGFKLMDNFKQPFFSRSIAEFWKKWHISLSSWFKDYLYIPLGGDRVPVWRWQFNIFIVFLVSGLWHGANWTFILWGALHGFYIIFSIWTENIRSRITKAIGLNRFPTILTCLQVLTTFSLFSFSLIFFRSKSVADAFYIVSNLFTGYSSLLSLSEARSVIAHLGGLVNFAIPVAAVAFIEIVDFYQQRKVSIRRMISLQPVWIRWAAYYSIILCIIVFAEISSKSQQFIYFQF